MSFESFVALTPSSLVIAIVITIFAGFVKGSVGFALPMIMIAGLGSFIEPELAVAGLVLPALIANLVQAFRQGVVAAFSSIIQYWRFLFTMMICIAISAQFLTRIPGELLFLLLGLPVSVFAGLMLAGWSPHISADNRIVEFGVAVFAGMIGGLSGVWGPPTVLYLTALGTEKRTLIRLQGIIYGAGALVLTLAHLKSGVLSGASLRLSMVLVFPALLGVVLGFGLQDRLDQKLFRKLTLIILVIAGLNLVRRGISLL